MVRKLVVGFILVMLIAFGWYLHESFKIATGYTAKYICSHMYLSGLTPEKASEGLSFFPINKVDFETDDQKKSVTATLLGMSPQTATYYERGRWCGCSLHGSPTIDSDETFNHSDLRQKIWPLGDRMQDSVIHGPVHSSLGHTLDSILDRRPSIHAIVVAKDTSFLSEAYNAQITPDTRLLGWSMTKSLTHAMIGDLVENGYLEWEDDHLFERWEGDDRETITLGDLLQMSSGLDWNENYNMWSDVTDMLYMSEDVFGDVTDQDLGSAPGESWNYSSGTTNILSGLIRQTLKEQGLDYGSYVEGFFERLGMTSMTIEMDPKGLMIMSSYGWATARDWTRFGLLYLFEGEWGKDRIFDSTWHRYSYQSARMSGDLYGAQFWLNRNGVFDMVPEDAYFPNGFGGQRILIIPSEGMVITILSGYEKDGDFNDIYGKILEVMSSNSEE